MNKAFIFTVTKNNLINEITLCLSSEELENRFADELIERGIEPCDIHFENGYFEFEDGYTVCMNTAYPSDKKATGLNNLSDKGEFIRFIECDCGEWEQFPSDMARHKSQSFTWIKNDEHINEATYQCSCGKNVVSRCAFVKETD